MLSIIQSPQFENDLIDIWLYVAEDQPLNADRLLDRFSKVFIRLAEMPNIGKSRSELGTAISSFPIANFNIYYRVHNNQLELIRLLSASRDINYIEW